jgi:HSP20 family protein
MSNNSIVRSGSDWLLDDFFGLPFGGLLPLAKTQGSWEVISHPDKVLIRGEIPGYNKENISIKVLGNTLSIHGEVTQEQENNDIFSSRATKFQRSWALPRDADLDAIQADMKDGVLVVTVPTSGEENKSIEIPIK